MEFLWVDPSSRTDAEEYISWLGARLRDKWILRALISSGTCQQQHAHATCLACRKSWPEVLLWPGMLQTHTTFAEVAFLKDALVDSSKLVSAVCVRGRFLSKCTEILPEAGSHVLELCPGPLIFRPPSLCPPCCNVVQRRPLPGTLPPFAVLVRCPPEASRFVSMQEVLSRSVSPFPVFQPNMILEESEIELGEGRRAMHLVLSDWVSLQRMLRLALPGSSVDYLPPPPASGRFFVAVAPLPVFNTSLHCKVQDVAEWLITAGRCDVVDCSLEVGTTQGTIIAELRNLASWQQALALNGEILQSIVTVTPRDGMGMATPEFLPTVLPARRRIKLHWLRAIASLPKSARRLVIRFMPPAPVMVPADAPSIEAALAMSPQKIFLAPGRYFLPQGLALRGPIELAGDGSVELVVGAPIVICSQLGAVLKDLRIVARSTLAADHKKALSLSAGYDETLHGRAHESHANAEERIAMQLAVSESTADARDVEMAGPPSLVCVHSSYITAIGKAYRKYSEMTPEGLMWAFASCTWGKPAVVFERCHFQGGHHALDVRGRAGLKSRAGRRSKERVHAQGFDLGRWLAQCRTVAEEFGPAKFESVFPDRAYCPQWAAYPLTRVRLLDCELVGAEQEAVHVWRGGELEVDRCWVHHCGQGISVNRCTEIDLTNQLGPAKPTELIVVDSCFEDISSHAWSSAVSVGHLVSGANASDGSRTISATLTRNMVRRCSSGIVCFNVNLHAEQNTFLDLGLVAMQLCNVACDLQGNVVERCSGTALALSASPDEESHEGRGSFSRLHGNTYRCCKVGIRLTTKQATPCLMEAKEETFDANRDAVIVLSAQCVAKLISCTLQGSHCCGARVGHGARGCFEACSFSGNGRGIAAAVSSSIEVRNCHFVGNVGWAVRLEDRPPTSENSGRIGEDCSCVVSGNVFGHVQRGSVGSKRIRFDGWDVGHAQAEGNVEADRGAAVTPVLKRRRGLDDESDAAVERLSRLSLDA